MIKTVIFEFDGILKNDNNELKEGARELLRFLKTNGYTTVLASSDSESDTVPFLKANDIKKYFDHIVYTSLYDEKKPSPSIYMRAISRAYTHADKCLALDSNADGLQAAEDAGLKVVLVHEDEDVRAKLEKMADDTASSLFEVLSLIKSSRRYAC